MKRGWVESKDIRKADSDEENMREAGWVEVVLADDYEKAVGALRDIAGIPLERGAGDPGWMCLAKSALRDLGEKLASHRGSKGSEK